VKRVFDVVCALTGIVLLSPIFLIISVGIMIDSGFPVFFLQERVGKDGRLFKLFKFRTMVFNNHSGPAITVGTRDPRITRIGYWLRRFKLDELPQLFNVLKGDMSLVGPRPELKKFVDLYTPEQRRVITVKPGITDYASIVFRNENELLEGKPDPVDYYVREIMPVKLKLNLRYIERMSFWLDVRILIRTVLSIFSG
jgi:lipopolysaccharide/colanic/teichoic acid biosynthesis glycosyltransferase